MPHQQQQDFNTHQENTRQKDDTAFFASESAEIPPIQMQAESDRGDQANYLPARFNKLTASRLLGNEISTNAVGQETVRMPLQAKLTIGQPRDKYEQEADRVAKDVVQRLHNPNNGTQPELQRQEEERRRQGETAETILQRYTKVQRNPMTISGEAPRELEGEIDRARSGGQPLAPKLQRSMGEAMGADFSSVKVHTGNEANRLNQSIQAKAFTTGQDVFFKRGAYDPGSKGGQELIAHELTHVVQQNPENRVEQSIQRQNVKSQISSTSNVKIQRTLAEAVNLANQYIGKKIFAPSPYLDINTVLEELEEDYKLTNDQIENVEDAYSAKEVKDESGNVVPFEPLTPQQKQELAQRKQLLGNLSQTHTNVLNYIEQQVNRAFGKTGVNQFYRGAHIIFNDGNGAIYDGMFQRGRALAANATQNPTAPNVMDKNTGAGTVGQGIMDSMNPWGPGWDQPVSNAQLTKQQLDSGKMFKRRPNQNETSHYKGVQTDPNRPQLGIDFPIGVKGHLLFGVVPGSQQNQYNTFVQTEGAGFQNLYEHIVKHGEGAWDNWRKALQTGMIGTSTQSEKTQGGSTALKEQ